MLILAFKLFLTPLLIVSVTLAGRRWGSAVSGLLIGLPLVSGPISFIIAFEHGLLFASQAAIGNLAGEISNTLFCLTYFLLAPRCSWPLCSLTAVGSFFVATAVLNCITWQLWPTFFIEVCIIVVCGLLLKPYALPPRMLTAPRWDLPARIITATVLTFTLTTIADRLGPHLSCMISPFPAFSLIFAAFTHSQQGGKSAANLLRGVIVGSGGYSLFFLLVGALLPTLGILLTYLLATLIAVAAGALTFYATRKK